MKTCYIRFCQVYEDPVWSAEALSDGKSHLVRCTRNVLRRAVFEWCATGRELSADELAVVKRLYPLVLVED